MKFHNQKSFKGHEISNVENKPLLHKKGKQWIVVAVSALILAGFGGIASTTTHADATNAQPATATKVAQPNQASNSGNASNVMKQAQGMHKALANNAAVQKPSAPSSAVAKKTVPASATSATSAKSGSVSASSSVSSKASSSVSSASAKSSVTSNNNSNNKATKPAVHMMLMSAPTPTKTGNWGTATWKSDGNGNLTLTNGVIQDGELPTGLKTSDIKSITTNPSSPVIYYLEGAQGQFANAYENNNVNTDTSGTGYGTSAHFSNLQSIDFSGMNFEHDPSVQNSDQLFNPLTNGGGGGADYPSMKAMFAGDTKLSTVKGLHVSPATHLVDMSGMFADCPALSNLDLSQVYTPNLAFIGNVFHGDTGLKFVDMSNINTIDITKKNASNSSWGFEHMFSDTPKLQSINLGPKTILNGDTGIAANGDWIKVTNNSANLLTSNDVNNSGLSTGSWQPTEDSGEWGSTSWGLDNKGNLVLQGGQITNNKVDAKDNNHNELDWSKVQHIYTNNVQAPADMSYAFANNPSGIGTMSYKSDTFPVESINLSGMTINTSTTNMYGLFNNDRNLNSIAWPTSMNTSNIQNMGWMFAGDYALTNLTLPSDFNTTDANMSDMFDSDVHLNQLSLPNNFQNKNNNSLFGAGGTVPLYEITLQPSTTLGSSSSLPNDTWFNSNQSKDTNELVNSGNDGTWRRNATETINYTWWNNSISEPITQLYGTNITITNDNVHSTGKLPSYWNLYDTNATYNITDNGNTYIINNLTPATASLTVNYKNGNNTLGSFTFHDYNGYTHANDDHDNIHYTTAIRFGTDGKTNSSSWHQNNSDWICDASNIQSDWDNVPAGYHVVDTSTVYPELNDTKPIEVAPNESASDTIHYQYKNNTIASTTISKPNGYYINGLNSVLGGYSDGIGMQGMPQGYQLVNKSDALTKSIKIDSQPCNIAVTPIPANAKVQYKYNNQVIASDTIQGNISSAQDASDTSTNITNGNDTGIPTGYHLANSSTKVPFDNGNHSVAILPNTASEKVFYKNGNTQVASDSISGNDSSARGANNTTFDANSKMPQGYQLADNQSKDINYDGQNHNIAITPIKVTDTINYQYNGKTLASHQFSGNNEHATQAGNNSVDVTSTNDSGISNGYHLVNKDNSFNYDGGTHSVSVAPNTESEQINYIFHSGASAFNEGSTIMTGFYGSSSNVNGSGLSAGYKLSNANTQFTYSNDNNSMNVSVVPSTATDTINYQYNHNTLTTQTFTGNDYRASQAGNNSFNVTSKNDSKIPANYHLASANNSFSYNNQSYDVAIEPNQVTNTINYLYKGSQVGSSTFTGNDYQAKDASNTSFTISNGNAPEYYHLASGVQTSFSYNGSTSNVAVEPNTITVNYMNGSNKVSIATSTFNGKHTTISDDFAIPTGYQLAQTNDSLGFTSPSSTSNVAVTPIQKTDTINYMNNDVKVASDVYTGNDMYASDAGHTSYNANDYVPAGYHVVNDGGNTFYFDGQTHNVTVYPNAFIIKFNNGKLGSMPVSNLKGTTYKLDLNKLPSYYHLANNSSDVIDLDTLGKSTTYNINLLPNTITVNYKNGNNKISSDTATFDGNKKDNAISADYDLPAGYQLAQANNQIQFNKPTNNVDVSVKPISKTDIINYMNNGTKVGSAQVSGEDMYANDSTFDANDHVPAGYHAVDANNNFHYDGQNHNVVVKPNTITLNYKYNNEVVGYDTIAYNPSSKVNDDYDMPAGYQLTQANNQLQFNKPANVVDVPVKPVNKTDIINYMNNGTKVSSTKASGVDVYANGSAFDANKSVPVGYYAVDANNDFYYDGQQHDVAVKPDTITLNYMNGTKRISSDTVTFNGNSNISADYNIPAGYQLAQNNNQLKFNQPSNVVNVSVKPVTKTDTINYMYNDTKVGTAKASGEDVYANASTFNGNNGVPAGYHAVDSNNGFYYDGQIHDVSVAPNVDTDTVNYQVNGKTLASQQFTGNDEHATQAGNNSFDVTAKNDTKMPNGYELVNNNNEFSFDNGSHDVAVQAIPQPSVPFVPSMPASSASSTSSSASAPASMAAPTSEKPTKTEPATHYQYTKVVTPLQLHTSKHFTKKNGVLTIKHPTEFKIMKIVHDHKYTRYEVRYNHKNYFITANDHFTINNYVQKHDFNSHKHMVVKVIKPMIEYKHIHYSKKNAIRNIHKGAILSVKRVITIGKGEKTRFELTNGRFVTSNKLFVKVIK